MSTSANARYAWILSAYQKSVDNAVTLATQLDNDIISAQQSLSAGAIMTVSGNGLSTTFAGTNLSPERIIDVTVEIRRLFDLATLNLQTVSDTHAAIPTPTDLQVKTEMLALCVPVRRLSGDYTDLRLSGFPLSFTAP